MAVKVYIRADGSPSIGLGHLVRCIALAHMLKKGFSIEFVCKEVPEGIAADITGNGFELRIVKDENDLLEDLKASDIVVLDHYGLDTDYQQRIKEKGNSLVCIDDLHDKEFVADLIINHAPGIAQEDYKAKEYTRFALGIDYALLRPSFLEKARCVVKEKKIVTVLINFGGSDPKNITLVALREAVKFDEIKTIHVVVGSANKALSEIKSFSAGHEKVQVHHAVDEDTMLKLMASSQLAIVPSSGVLLEALAAGCEIISGYYVDNQKLIYDGYNELGVFFDAGDFGNIGTAMKEALETPPRNNGVIDGHSGERIFDKFKNLI